MPPSGKPEDASAVLDCGRLKVAITPKGRNRLLVEFWGELDLGTAEALEKRLYVPRRTKVDLDLSGLTFVDVRGLRLLTSLMKKSGGRANVLATSAAVTRTVEVGRKLPR